MRRTHRVAAVVTSCALAFVSAGAAPAGAQQQRMETLRQRGITEIVRRQNTLSELTKRVNAAHRLTVEHHRELVDQLEEQRSRLTALRSRVAAGRRMITLRRDVGRIVTDYRVYVLTVPKVRGTVVADIVLAALDRMGDLAGPLEDTIERAKDSDEKEAAKADLAALKARLGATRVKVETLAATLLSLQPAGYPANRPTLESVGSDLRSAGTALREAVALARQIVKTLD